MTSTTQQAQQSEYALAAYANFSLNTPPRDALRASDFTLTQADKFIGRNTVLTQYSDAASGFSATVFKDASDNVTIAIRGTQDAADFGTDTSIIKYGAAYDQIVELANWWLRASNLAGTGVRQYQLSVYSSIESQTPPSGSVLLYSTTSETGVITSTYLESADPVNATGEIYAAVAADTSAYY